jgi:hypothetical protein
MKDLNAVFNWLISSEGQRSIADYRMLIVNFKAALAIGLQVPPALITRADDVTD